jgi:ornithine cyclodeaminase/alanine dehydrogenase-like protein (mu-crystallin family)
MKTLILSKSDVLELINMKLVLEEVEKAFKEMIADKAKMPQSPIFHLKRAILERCLRP